MTQRLKKRAGFTLIELMIVVSIIGILAVIAIPKFANLVRKAREGMLKGNLGTLRGALSIYYSDMEGQFPQGTFGNDGLLSLTINGKYLSVLPIASIPDYHQPPGPSAAEVDKIGGAAANLNIGDSMSFAFWAYFADPTEPTWGQVIIFCNHTDTKGTLWTSY